MNAFRAAVLFGMVGAAHAAFAQINPVYQAVFSDAVTGGNSFQSGGSRYWSISSGADSYQNDVYERPTTQTYTQFGTRYGAEEYFGYLDLVGAKVGADANFLYVSLDLFGLDKSTKDGQNTQVGLMERYGFRLSNNVDGRFGSLFFVDQPASLGTTFTTQKSFGFRDSNGDVGGRGLANGSPSGIGVTKSDNPQEEQGMNGYDQQTISDGRFNGQNALFSRLNPNDSSVVEFALNYRVLGLSSSDLLSLKYFEFEAIKGGPKDPQNYRWNDKYTRLEAGSPYLGSGGLSTFGTQGLGNIYELDTMAGVAAVPEPGTLALIGAGLLGLAKLRRRKADKSV